MLDRFCRTVFLFFAACFLIASGRAAGFTASLDRDAITLGEQATLSLTFEGGQPGNISMSQIAGLQITQVGHSSQSTSDFNGHSTTVTSVLLAVAPQQTGEFVIPAIHAEISGQKVSSQPLKLTVTKAVAPSADVINSGSKVAFLKLSFPKQKIYVGEPAVMHLDLYLRDEVQDFGNFQLTDSPTEGFSAGKVVELPNQRRRVQIGNRVFTIIPYTIPLTALKTGAFALGPFTGSVVVVLPAQNQNSDPFFGRFFSQGEQKQVTLATDPVNVESLALPEPNKPANFTGAVGDFTMTATAGPTNVTVGDPITVRVQISGRGALDSVTLPLQDAWRDFKMYPPTTKFEPGDPFGFQGTKTFEQIISPQNSDVHELPPLSFSFFNPDDSQYHTLTQAAVPLVVKAAGVSPMPVIAANKTAAQENQPPQDILPIKENLGTLAVSSPPLVTRPAFLAAQAVPVLAFLAAFVWRKRTDSLANNPRLRRQRAVAALIASGMDDLKKYAAANQPDEFFATLFRLLQEQLGEWLDCPASAITENVIDEHAVLRNAPAATLADLRELFQLCNHARYALVRGSSELNSVAAKFEQAVGELQEVKA
jgi:hypothetical protein